MRPFPPSLAAQAQASGLHIHNYFSPARYVEVFIPEKVIGCMVRGKSRDIIRFVKLIESAETDLEERNELVADMSVEHLGMRGRNGTMAVCFPDWQFEPEGDA